MAEIKSQEDLEMTTGLERLSPRFTLVREKTGAEEVRDKVQKAHWKSVSLKRSRSM